MLKNFLWKWGRPVFSLLLGLSMGLILVWMVGESPVKVMEVLVKSAFGSWYDFGMTLAYATPLLFTGLAVALPLQVGLFNIGAEGQLTLGALAAAVTGIYLKAYDPRWAPLAPAVAAFAAGGLWGSIPALLRTWRGTHEVISSIMLNFVAAALASWITIYGIKNPESQNPESIAVHKFYHLPGFSFFEGAPVNLTFLMALILLGVYSWLVWKSKTGYRVRAVGANPVAAEISGIPIQKYFILSMVIGGGVAGLVGVGEVLGNAGRFRLGFSPDFGFIGIAVALLGRGKPLGILFSALLLGALHKGSLDLDIETESITRDLAVIFQALVILAVSSDGIWNFLFVHRSKAEAKVEVSS